MKFFDFKNKIEKKQKRFRRQEFQDKLQKARKYKRTAPSKSNLAPRFYWYFIAILFLIFIYFLFFSKIFLVKDAIILSEGLPESQVEDLLDHMSNERDFFIPTSHILLMSKEKFTSILQESFPDLREIVHFRRIFPDRVALDFELRKPAYVWQTGDKYYYLDQDGVVYELIDSNIFSIEDQILLTDTTASPVEVGEKLDISKKLQFIESLQEFWQMYVKGLNYQSFSFPGTESIDVFVLTSSGFRVYFDLNRDVVPQLQNLALLLNQEIAPDTWSGLSYIDLRFADMAYYCYKDAPCSPEYQEKMEKEEELAEDVSEE